MRPGKAGPSRYNSNLYQPFRILDSRFESSLRGMVSENEGRMEEEGAKGLNGELRTTCRWYSFVSLYLGRSLAHIVNRGASFGLGSDESIMLCVPTCQDPDHADLVYRYQSGRAIHVNPISQHRRLSIRTRSPRNPNSGDQRYSRFTRIHLDKLICCTFQIWWRTDTRWICWFDELRVCGSESGKLPQPATESPKSDGS